VNTALEFSVTQVEVLLQESYRTYMQIMKLKTGPPTPSQLTLKAPTSVSLRHFPLSAQVAFILLNDHRWDFPKSPQTPAFNTSSKILKSQHPLLLSQQFSSKPAWTSKLAPKPTHFQTLIAQSFIWLSRCVLY